MSYTPNFSSVRSRRNRLRIITVMTLSLALVGGFLVDVARQYQPAPSGSSELRS